VEQRLSRSQARQFLTYVSRSVAGMLGISCYIIVDTLFISIAAGSDGITALNLCLPIYNLIFALGAMIGIGSAIRFAVAKGRNDADAALYFPNACCFTVLIGLVFTAAAIVMPERILRWMGSDDAILPVGLPYIGTFMLFAPFTMLNYVFSAFVRNDNDPSLAMLATVCGSLANVVFDYILMFPLGMGMRGAALATAFSPLASIAVCSLHFRKQGNTVRFVRCRPSVKRLIHACRVGVSAFIGEFSSGMITVLFNLLILAQAGNVGVAAYGITANLALVAMAIFNGIAQGAQPLISERFGRGDRAGCRGLLRLSVGTSAGAAAVMYALIFAFTVPIIAAFNTQSSARLADLAFNGLRLYFIGLLFAGVNTAAAGYLSAADQPGPAMAVSVLRGIVLIALCAFALARCFGMTGIWLAFPAAEALTMIASAITLKNDHQRIP